MDSLNELLSSCPIARKLAIINSIELENIFTGKDLEQFLDNFLPVFDELIKKRTKPQFKASTENDLRMALVKLVGRLAFSDLSRLHGVQLMDLMLYLFNCENESVGLVVLRIIGDLFKNCKVLVIDRFQSFIDIVVHILQHISTQLSTLNDTQQANAFVPCTKSFKVLIECPIIVVSLFQLNREAMSALVPRLIPHIVHFLSLKITFQNQKPNPEIKNKKLFDDFIGAQVKSLSFLAYVIKGFNPAVEMHKKTIPLIVVQLLMDCPSEAAFARKELLVATRHILSSDYREVFLPFLEYLLDENVLLGNGLTCSMTLKTLAFSTLADLVHHVRTKLPPSAFVKIISLFSSKLYDSSLSISIQTMITKLLMNLIEPILALNFENINEQRSLFISVLYAFVKRLEKLKEQLGNPITPEKMNLNIPCIEQSLVEQQRDLKVFVRTLNLGVRSVFYALAGRTPSSVLVFLAKGLDQQTVQLASEFLVNSIHCFQVFDTEEANGQISAEEKETFDAFSGSLAILEPHVLQDILNLNLDFLIEKMSKRVNLLTIFQTLLTLGGVSRILCSILIKYLMENIQRLGSGDIETSQLFIRLFKLVFASVTMYTEDNESVLQPFISELILVCLKNPSKAKDPIQYFLLLRALFRSIGGGRFELLYKEVLPLLPVLLETLNGLLDTCSAFQIKDLFVELCLTTPVRLSVLLPYLPLLMRPLVHALNSSSFELLNQGLRTLELCIDNLTQEFLDPILQPVMDQILPSLWMHLKPLPYNQIHAQTSMRILGKLSGRNRRIGQDPRPLEFKEFIEPGASIKVKFFDSIHSLPLDDACSLACDILTNREADEQLKESAFKIVESTLVNFLNLRKVEPESLFNITKSEQKELLETRFVNPEASANLLKLITVKLFACSLDKDLGKRAVDLLKIVYGQFAIIRAHELKRTPNEIDSNVLVDALIEVISSEDRSLHQTVETILTFLYSICFQLVGEKVNQLSLFFHLASRFSSLCYQRDFSKKRGGCFGISTLIKFDFGLKWLWAHELKFCRGLLFVLKDHSNGPINCNVSEANVTISSILKICNRPQDFDEITRRESQQVFNQLISLLVSELSNPNQAVRETIQANLLLLAESIGSEVTDLLLPIKDRFLVPIFTKPLRALPFNIQVGNIDAVTFCLSLRPPLVTFNEELNRLLQEALALAEAEDHALVSRTSHYKSQQSILNLRVVCLKLLAVAMACPDLHDPSQNQINHKIVSFFFKSLYAKSPEVIEVAKKGLEQVIVNQQQFPRELLQQALRPVLVNLSDARRLSVYGLQGLGRLMQILTSYFKVEIGSKMTEHLKTWTDLALGDTSLNLESQQVKIISALLAVFSMLPTANSTFTEQMISTVIELENALKISFSSPLRDPLIKYFIKYPSEAFDYFLPKLDQTIPFNLFVFLLKNCSSLKSELEKIAKELFIVDLLKGTSLMKRIRTITVISILSQSKEWLVSVSLISKTLVSILEELPLESFELTIEILFEFFKAQINQILVFDLIKVLNKKNMKLKKSFDFPINNKEKEPLIKKCFEFPCEQVVSCILKPLLVDFKDLTMLKPLFSVECDEQTAIQILNLSLNFNENIDEILHFSELWSKSNDPLVKYSSFVVISNCYKLKKVDFELILNLVKEIFEHVSSDVKLLARQALEILFSNQIQNQDLANLDQTTLSGLANSLKKIYFETCHSNIQISLFWSVFVQFKSFRGIANQLTSFIISSTVKLSCLVDKTCLIEVSQMLFDFELDFDQRSIEGILTSLVKSFISLGKTDQQSVKVLNLIEKFNLKDKFNSIKLEILENDENSSFIPILVLILKYENLDTLKVSYLIEKAFKFTDQLPFIYKAAFEYKRTEILNKFDFIISDLILNTKNLILVSELIFIESQFIDSSVRIPLLVRLLNKVICSFETISNEESSSCVTLLNLLSSKTQQMGELRQLYISTCVQIISNGNFSSIHATILEIITNWILNKKPLFPTLQEKSQLLLACQALENHNETLFEEFLNLVAKVYSDQSFHGTELTFKLQKTFLLALSHKASHVRELFFEIYESNLPKTLSARMNFFLGVQDWEFEDQPLFWLTFVLRSLLRFFSTNSIESSKLTGFDAKGFLVSDSENLVLKEFCSHVPGNTPENLVASLEKILITSPSLVSKLFSIVFKICFDFLKENERKDFISNLNKFLPKLKSTCVPALVEAFAVAKIALPGQLVFYLGKTHNAWFESLEILEQSKDELSMNSLSEMYKLLGEQDLFLGFWKRRSAFPETLQALSCEQVGSIEKAQNLYEQVQVKARLGQLPFTEAEYYLWEERWLSSAMELQQWDIIQDVAKMTGDRELTVEASFRLNDWTVEQQQINLLVGSIQESPRKKAFEAFLLLKSNDQSAFQQIYEQGIQSAIKHWTKLPKFVSNSHYQILHEFQQFVELSESNQVLKAINPSSDPNIRSQLIQEMKSVLTTWRDRLPNQFDDLNLWSDLAAWRLHVFGSITHTYQAVIIEQQQQAQQTQAQVQNSFAFKGFHETAWIYNKLAKVSRKHELTQVSLNYLTKIYTLPNIEVLDAFMKLKEQVKSSDSFTALEVINATNLGYFTNQQKSEFFTLKANALFKLGLNEEANKIYAQAVQIDLNLAKGWSNWGKFNDFKFIQTKDLNYCVHAINCYLQASSLYKNSKSRNFLIRILYLLGFEQDDTLAKSFELYNELPIWYWITFIPQLLNSLNRAESKQVKLILMKIAKSYPQALFCPLRALIEERSSLTNAEDLLATLKTAHPLLALSMENMVEHIIQRLRSNGDEDLYRIISSLLNEAYQQTFIKQTSDDELGLNSIDLSLVKVSEMLQANHLQKYKLEFDQTFITISNRSLNLIVLDLLKWKQDLEALVEKIPKFAYLENLSRYLIEFEHLKYDEVEIFGQYLELKDSNSDFLKISRFEPLVEIQRKHGNSFRKLSLRASNGTIYSFSIQNPVLKNFKREEKLVQMFRLMNSRLEKSVQCRKRNLNFSCPLMIPLSNTVRLIQDDSSTVSLDDILNQSRLNAANAFSRVMHFSDEIICLANHKVDNFISKLGIEQKRGNTQILNIKMEVFDEITELISNDLLLDYFLKSKSSFNELFLLRTRFTKSLAAFTVLSYSLAVGHRSLSKLGISTKSGNLVSSDLLPNIQNGLISLSEPVPFRLTPNIQKFIGAHGLEGPFIASMISIAKALTEPDFALNDLLLLFIRDENLGEQNVDLVNKRLNSLVNSSVDLMSCAVNPQKLSQMESHWHPWF